MTPQREEHLYHQYVIPIVNDGVWYRAADEHICKKNGAKFLRESSGFVRAMANKLQGHNLEIEERAYVYLHMWQYHGGEGEDLLRTLDVDTAIAVPLHKMLMARAAPQPAPQPEPQEDQPVNNTTPAFETKHFVFGMDVANMTSGQLLEAIKKIENEIADLKAVKSKSEFIKKRIAELDGMLVKVVEVLDAK